MTYKCILKAKPNGRRTSGFLGRRETDIPIYRVDANSVEQAKDYVIRGLSCLNVRITADLIDAEIDTEALDVHA